MKLTLQKILVFIPIVNITVVVFWLISRMKSRKPFPQIVVWPIIAVGACLVGGMIRTITDLIFESSTIYNVITYGTLYLQSVVGPFFMLLDEIQLKKEG